MFDRLKIMSKTQKGFDFWNNFGSVLPKILLKFLNIGTFKFFYQYFKE